MRVRVFITGYGMRPMDKPLRTIFRYARLLRYRGISPVYVSFGHEFGGVSIGYTLKRAVAPVPKRGTHFNPPTQSIEEAEAWMCAVIERDRRQGS